MATKVSQAQDISTESNLSQSLEACITLTIVTEPRKNLKRDLGFINKFIEKENDTPDRLCLHGRREATHRYGRRQKALPIGR